MGEHRLGQFESLLVPVATAWKIRDYCMDADLILRLECVATIDVWQERGEQADGR